MSQDDTASMFLDESSYNLTCLPTGHWSLDLFACREIFCEPITVEEKSVKQEVLEDPNDDLVGYRTEFILSCRKKYEVFEFGDKLTSVDYFCNRRYVFLLLQCGIIFFAVVGRSQNQELART